MINYVSCHMQMILLWFLNNINWQVLLFKKLIIRKQKGASSWC
ncbi:hypothetical protein PROVRETT_06971 [Providencia rettgeri DSM 1131]|nr:hypothetical protein PROVRETT_06971 [Providencia rettgeri DSM 1131]